MIVVIPMTAQADDNLDKKTILLNPVKSIPWEMIRQKKIVFVYRSVGRDILEGIKEMGRKNDRSEFIFIDEDTMNRELKPKRGFFLQQWLNMNSSPQDLKKNYEDLLDRIQVKDIDFAMVRFSPFFDDNLVEENFKKVQIAIEDLKKEFPDTEFLISTFPLTHSKTSLKTWIKKLIGQDDIWEYDSNITVNEFNRHMRETYGNEATFFDLAKIQSTYPNGERSTFTKKGKSYYHMVSEYTHDGTHLSAKGREVVAEQLLILIGRLVSTSK